MGLRLTVDGDKFDDRVASVAAAFPGLIPVIKGNGYGFGRPLLFPIAARVSDTIAVGTVYEAVGAPADRRLMVLTPHVAALPENLAAQAMLTVGSLAHVDALTRASWRGEVVVKLESSMHRYGVSADHLDELASAVVAAGLTCAGYALHLPLDGSDEQRLAEIEAWLPKLDDAATLSVSHLGASTYAQLCAAHPDRRFRIRLGTQLWHGDKQHVRLSADVLEVRTIRSAESAGYRRVTVPADGSLVMIAAGSAHGVQPLDDGRSPFHFEQRRLTLLEPPHMHTSMVFVPAGESCPSVGDHVDVQRPLTTTNVDEVAWIDD